jgi:hypothetical protein
MKNSNLEARDTDPAPLPFFTLFAFVSVFAVATALCLWQDDVAAVLALLCVCPMTLIAVVGHNPPKTRPARLEIRRDRALRYMLA